MDLLLVHWLAAKSIEQMDKMMVAEMVGKMDFQLVREMVGT